jgi:formylglycine-generating enzyme required for sulfatase activity
MDESTGDPRVDADAVEAIGRIAIQRAQQPVTAPTETAGSRRIADSLAEPVTEPPSQKPTFSFEVVSVDNKGNITQRQQKSAEYRRESLGQGIDLDLVLIPSGTFTMGSPATEAGRDWYKAVEESLDGVNVEGPQHRVSVALPLLGSSPLWFGKYPVTQAQWRAVAALPQINQELNPDPSEFKGDKRPVEQVSWDDAVEFCQRLSKYTGRAYRLPSEAEWEYACRAGTTTPFHFGPTITTDLANYAGIDVEEGDYKFLGTYGEGPKGEYREQTTDVGNFPPNAFGLYYMHGNVLEWCEDHWHDNYEGSPIDGSAWKTSDDNAFRLLRGGSCLYIPFNCRSAFRSRVARDLRDSDVGFRVVCASSWTL